MLDKLLRQARRGDEAALGQVVERFRPLVLATAKRLTTQATDWDDLVQEGFLALVAAVYAFNPQGSAGFPWYAKRQVYYALYNYRRREHRQREREQTLLNQPGVTEETPTPAELLACTGPEPGEVVVAREKINDLTLALAQLPERQARVVIGIHLHGTRVIDLAKELAITPSSVKGLEARGLANLRKHLEEKGLPKGYPLRYDRDGNRGTL